MAKYGKGLGREFAEAVLRHEIREPFTTEDVRAFVQKRGWPIGDNYVNVLLQNGSSPNHSLTYKKYFVNLHHDGLFELSDLAKKELQ